MRTILLAAVIAFAVTAVIGKPIIHWLRKMKFGQKILEIGPKWHMNKQNIPTMGGFMFMIGIAVSMLILSMLTGRITEGAHAAGNFFAVLLIAFAYGLVGMVDDWAKIKKKQNAGLSPMQKLLLQVVVAAVFLSLLRLTGGLSSGVWIPGVGITLELPWIVYLIFAIVVVVGCDNAVNLTDGIDGLAASVTVPVAIFFAAVGYCQNNPGVMAFAGALTGALLGFLIYNFNPAKVFMGDTGSLFLGGAVAGLAFACDMPLMLLPVGIIYICETLSVILQVSYFKATHGKRLFKMAPIHHHFEMCGWSERKIVGVFTTI
ncbi:MAG: phospho-N-acetylmuramoyl-pentapeptide-transferase, partial [Butyricicoccus sp.]